ncbi:hypothetical protein ACRRTK_010011 [Alexandromys fortis]
MPSFAASEDLFKRVHINQDSSDQDHDLDVMEKTVSDHKTNKARRSTPFDRRPASGAAEIAYRGQQAQETLMISVCRLLQPTVIMTPSKLGVRRLLTPPSSSDPLPVVGEHLHRILLQTNTTGNGSLLPVSTVSAWWKPGEHKGCATTLDCAQKLR